MKNILSTVSSFLTDSAYVNKEASAHCVSARFDRMYTESVIRRLE